MEKPIVKIGVNIFVFNNKEQILLGKRIGKVGNGTWGLPGGYFEYGELLKDAVKRELLEETGIIADNVEFAHIINDPLEDCHYVHINFVAKNWNGEPKVTEPDKFSEWCWFDLENLPQPIFIGHKKIFPAFKNKAVFVDTK